MAIQHYEGPLGTFDYNPDLWKVAEYQYEHPCLRYVGDETNGADIEIPKGIIDCNNMFYNSKITSAPAIPDGVINCADMFRDCASLKTADIVIPSSVEACDCMFFGCHELTVPPTIPKTVKDCSGMFNCCSSLKIAPAILNGVENCSAMFMLTDISEMPDIPDSVIYADTMFYGCRNLVKTARLSDNITDCSHMFDGCSKLENPANIPLNAEICQYMYAHCSSLKYLPAIPKSVSMATGIAFDVPRLEHEVEWNMLHRGHSYHDYFEFVQSNCSDEVRAKLDDESYADMIILTACSYDDSNKSQAYGNVLQGALSGVYDTYDDIFNEYRIADKFYNKRRSLLDKNMENAGLQVDAQVEHEGFGE